MAPIDLLKLDERTERENMITTLQFLIGSADIAQSFATGRNRFGTKETRKMAGKI